MKRETGNLGIWVGPIVSKQPASQRAKPRFFVKIGLGDHTNVGGVGDLGDLGQDFEARFNGVTEKWNVNHNLRASWNVLGKSTSLFGEYNDTCPVPVRAARHSPVVTLLPEVFPCVVGFWV